MTVASGGSLDLRSKYQIMRKIQDDVKNEGNGSETNYSAHINIEKMLVKLWIALKLWSRKWKMQPWRML